MLSQNIPTNRAEQDRASRMATAVIGIVIDDLRRWLRADCVSLADSRRHVAQYLRDEITDIERAVLNDTRAE